MKRITTEQNARRSTKTGFTLIELLVVMAIIMILMAIMLKGFGFMAQESRVKACWAKMDRIAAALDEYYRENGKYSPTHGANPQMYLVPKYLDAADLIDPWGTPLEISITQAGDYSRPIGYAGTHPEVLPFSIKSFGPNRIVDSSHSGLDDVKWPRR
jgi:prepilin-type N-terminal cleavage/methylation domain-containing protein